MAQQLQFRHRSSGLRLRRRSAPRADPTGVLRILGELGLRQSGFLAVERVVIVADGARVGHDLVHLGHPAASKAGVAVDRGVLVLVRKALPFIEQDDFFYRRRSLLEFPPALYR